MVLEGVENMGSTGGIRAISLAFAQNWSGPSPPSGPRRPPSPLRPPPLCAFVFFHFFFGGGVMSGCFLRQDVAKRIMGKYNIMAVGD